jgi:kynurenine formamidase
VAECLIDLSHPIVAGMTTYPGMPAPEIDTFLSRAESAARLASGVSFHIGRLCLVANTGTYLDAPFHYVEDGLDVAGLALERLVDLPVVVVDARGIPAIGADHLGDLTAAVGGAVLVRTGWSRHWGTPDYLAGSPFLTRDAVDALLASGAVLAGIDALNIDDVDDTSRPAHQGLLSAGIAILEHLTALERLPREGARLTAVPAPVVGMGTMPVRAFARIPV